MFVDLVTLIRNDLLGLTEGQIPVKKLSKKFGIDDPTYLKDAIDAIAYLILHIAKLNATPEDYDVIFEQCKIDKAFKQPLFDIVSPQIEAIREMLASENERLTTHFKNLDWRLGLVVASRSRSNIMVPKYTLKFDFENDASGSTESVIMDSDYNNLKRLEAELKDALKSINSRYSKKVFKFIK